MPHRSWSVTATALVFSAAGLLLSATPGAAQPYGAYAAPPPEEVIVTAPRPNLPNFREEGGGGLRSMDVPPERVSLTTHVRYDDLDLTAPDGAYELRRRVRTAARQVCRNLAEAYPFYQISRSRGCYRDAVDRALVHADEAIQTARADYFYYGYEH
jgi:UrcA family protein